MEVYEAAMEYIGRYFAAGLAGEEAGSVELYSEHQIPWVHFSDNNLLRFVVHDTWCMIEWSRSNRHHRACTVLKSVEA